MLKPLIIWGASGHAKVLREFVCPQGYELVAVFDQNPQTPPPFPSIPLYIGRDGFAQWRLQHGPGEVAGLIAIGGDRGKDRCELQAFLLDQGVRMITAIHPTAFVAGDALIGQGCQVLTQAVVGVEVRLGDQCIINTAACVDHECTLGDGVHLAPGARLAGCVEVGRNVFIGLGALVLPRIKIGAGAIIGAGAVVTKDVPERMVAYGIPARPIRPT